MLQHILRQWIYKLRLQWLLPWLLLLGCGSYPNWGYAADHQGTYSGEYEVIIADDFQRGTSETIHYLLLDESENSTNKTRSLHTENSNNAILERMNRRRIRLYLETDLPMEQFKTGDRITVEYIKEPAVRAQVYSSGQGNLNSIRVKQIRHQEK